MTRKFTNAQVKSTVNAYVRNGQSLRKLSKIMNCHVRTLRELLRNSGVSLRTRRRPNYSVANASERVHSYFRDRRAGMRQSDIARKHGVTRQAVSSAIKRYSRDGQ